MIGPDEPVSADVDALDGFVAGSRAGSGALWGTHGSLAAGLNRLAALPLPFWVDGSPAVLDQYRELLVFMGENEQFVADISDGLKGLGLGFDQSLVHSTQWVLDAALAGTDAERLAALEQALIARGVEIAEAAAIRAAVEKQLARDPASSFYDATMEGLATHRGMTRAEAERATRAFTLTRVGAVNVIGEHFDAVAGRAGNAEQITRADLDAVIADDTAGPDLRDAAYRLRWDHPLYNDIDITRDLDLTSQPFEGYVWDDNDYILGRDDIQQFPAKDYQHRVLSLWHPLLDTADEGYDLGEADSVVGDQAVLAFINDQELPLYARLVVFDVYAERYQLDLAQRDVLYEEYALQTDLGPLPSHTIFTARQPLNPGRGPIVSMPSTGPTKAPTGPRSGGGLGAAALAAVAVFAVTELVDYGQDLYTTHRGDPVIEHIDPTTGQTTRFQLDELDGLTAGQRKAWIAHVAATGSPPTEPLDQILPHPYLDQQGQWRWSDSNNPLHDASIHGAADRPDDPLEGILLPPEGVYEDVNGQWRYRVDGHLYDGLLKAPSERDAPSSPNITENDRAAIADYTSSGYWEINGVLRGRDPTTLEVRSRIAALSQAIEKLPEFQGETLYRGQTSMRPGQLDGLHAGGFFRDSGFMSTTSDSNRTFSGKYQFKISYSTSGRVLGDLAINPSEREVLFPPGTMFDVVDVEIVDGVYWIEMEER